MPGLPLRLDLPQVDQGTPRALRATPLGLVPLPMGHLPSGRHLQEPVHRFLPHSPIPTLRICTFSLQDILMTANPLTFWQWLRPDGTPVLGNLRSMLSHHRVLAYRSIRDRLRLARGAPPIWLDSHQLVGPSAWFHRSRPLRQRVQALRTLWDLRWHGENRAVAAHSVDPHVSACPICCRLWNQAHVLCECPSFEPHVAIDRLPPGLMQELGRHLQRLLTIPNQPSLMARRWVGWAMGPSCHRGPSARDRSMLSEANQGGPRTHRQNHLRYHHCLLAGLHYNGARPPPTPKRLITPSTFG